MLTNGQDVPANSAAAGPPQAAATAAQVYGCTFVQHGARLLTAADDRLLEWDTGTAKLLADWRFPNIGEF